MQEKACGQRIYAVTLAWMRWEQIHDAQSLSGSPRRLGSRLWSLASEAQAETWVAGLALTTTTHPVQGWDSIFLVSYGSELTVKLWQGVVGCIFKTGVWPKGNFEERDPQNLCCVLLCSPWLEPWSHSCPASWSASLGVENEVMRWLRIPGDR